MPLVICGAHGLVGKDVAMHQGLTGGLGGVHWACGAGWVAGCVGLIMGALENGMFKVVLGVPGVGGAWLRVVGGKQSVWLCGAAAVSFTGWLLSRLNRAVARGVAWASNILK